MQLDQNTLKLEFFNYLVSNFPFIHWGKKVVSPRDLSVGLDDPIFTIPINNNTYVHRKKNQNCNLLICKGVALKEKFVNLKCFFFLCVYHKKLVEKHWIFQVGLDIISLTPGLSIWLPRSTTLTPFY